MRENRVIGWHNTAKNAIIEHIYFIACRCASFY